MLKPTSAFVYVFQDASTSEEDACVALTVGLEEGDCGFSANELHDASTITKIRNMDRFLTLILLKKCLWTKPPNGLRYPLVGGTRGRHLAGTNLKPRKLLENAPTPTTTAPTHFVGDRVHAVLAGLYAVRSFSIALFFL